VYYTNVNVIGDNILFRGIKNGKRVRQRMKYAPRLWVHGKGETDWKSLEGTSVHEVKFASISECRDFIKQYEHVENFPIYGLTRYDATFISDYFSHDFDWDISDLCIAYLDIEVGSENGFPEPSLANEEITAITVYLNKTYYVFGCGEYTPKRDDVVYQKCKSERVLVESFLSLWADHYPDIITGWNTKFFDIPYIVNRIARIFGDDSKQSKMLSPWGKIKSREVNFMNKKQICYEIVGISDLDYYELYRKFSSSPNQESYRLDHICSVELGENKLDYSDIGNLHQLYRLDYERFIDYNVKDVELIIKLEDKLKLLELVLTLAYDAKVNYDDVFSQVRMWDVITYNALKQKKIAVPPKKNNSKNEQYVGAYVKDPKVGMHNWVASFDLNSLYPSLIQQYNLSPEMLVEDPEDELLLLLKNRVNVDALLNQSIDTNVLQEKKVTITPNSQFFRTEQQGFLSELMEKMYDDRAEYKRKAIEAKKLLQKAKSNEDRRELEKQIAKYNNIQLAKKVTLNSAYGAIGNAYFRFFDIRIAEAITLTGQLAIRWIENKMNTFFNDILKTENLDFVIASDTDSIYLNLGPLIEKTVDDTSDKKKVIRYMNKLCDQIIQPYIDKSYQELAEYMNAYSQKMIMKREALSDKAIWTAKKRYVINVYDNEGVEYEKPQLKIMGLEAIKSSTPTVCREKIKEAFIIMIEKDEASLVKFIDDFRRSFKTYSPEDVAFPRGVSDIGKYQDKTTIFGKGTPIHVKGSLVYNHFLKEKKLTKQYESIKDGDKIKFMYVREPNPVQSRVIAFPNILPKELQLDSYLDYDMQFDKAFLEPLKIVINTIGWSHERQNTLESLFE
jgi:DNA polymerase elongation subunit (family B)